MLPKNRPPTHPGQMLLHEFLITLGLAQKELSKKLGWTIARLNEIINSHRGISADSALSLADIFNMEPKFWLKLQINWDLWLALKSHEKRRPLNKTA